MMIHEKTKTPKEIKIEKKIKDLFDTDPVFAYKQLWD